ncbi:MAG TPA: hypothetical protein VGF24_01655 [Vicinamibacterales bacterium]|jgi:hypothetical protein
MAFSIVQHVATDSAVNSSTVGATVSPTGAGNLLIAIPFCLDTGRTVSGVSDGTNAFTQATNAQATNSLDSPFAVLDAWYILSSASGKTTITATFTGSAGTFTKGLIVYEVTGHPAALMSQATRTIRAPCRSWRPVRP